MRKVVLGLAIMLVLGAQAFASPIRYITHLSGPDEVPPNASPGTGSALVIIDTVAHTLEIQVSFSGLVGITTASHIHCCIVVPGGTAMVATQTPRFVGFPVGVQSGTYSNTFDTSDPATWNASFITANGGTALGAEAAMAVGLAAGTAYLNVHTNLFPAGEIRGFLTPIPEPSTFLLLGSGLAGLALMRRRFIKR